MTVFRNLSGSKIFCKKIFGPWTEKSDYRRKCFLRVVKGTVHVSNAILWENDDKRKFYSLWLVLVFVCFFTLTRKLVRCVKSANQVYRGIIYRNFSVAIVFSKHFQILSREIWSFSKKVPAWLSQLHSMGPEEHFGVTFWSKF